MQSFNKRFAQARRRGHDLRTILSAIALAAVVVRLWTLWPASPSVAQFTSQSAAVLPSSSAPEAYENITERWLRLHEPSANNQPITLEPYENITERSLQLRGSTSNHPAVVEHHPNMTERWIERH